MEITNLLLYLTFALLFFGAFLRTRIFDFLSVYIVFYIYNYFIVTSNIIDFGGFSYLELYVYIPLEVKLLFLFKNSLLIFALFFNDKFFNKIEKNEYNRYVVELENLYSFFFISTLFLVVFYSVFFVEDLLKAKADAKESSGNLFAMVLGFSQVLLYISIKLQRKRGYLLCFFVAFLALFAGSRANILFFIVIGIFSYYGGERVAFLSVKKLFKVILIIPLVVFLLSIKVFYKDLKDLNFSVVLDKLSALDSQFISSLFLVESKSVNMNLITLCKNVDYSDHQLQLFFSAIPFLGGLYSKIVGLEPINSSKYLKENFYSIDFGMASSSIGEVCSYFGFEVLFLYFVMLVVFLIVLNRLFFKSSIFFLISTPTILVFMLYQNRTALNVLLSMPKLPVFMFLCFLVYKKISLSRQ